jgi:DNA polymerase-3 subunit beta
MVILESHTFSIEREELLSIVEKVIITCRRKMSSSGSTELPHFFYIRIDGYGDRIRFAAYNSMRRIEIMTSKVSPHEPFSVGVSASLLYSILKELPQGALNIDVSNEFRISNHTSSFSLDILLGEYFPSVEDNQDIQWRPVDYAKIFHAISKVRYCTGDSNNSKPYSRAVCLSKGFFMCTDGFRMSLFPNQDVYPEKDICLLAESCTALSTVFRDTDGGGYVYCDDSTIYLSKGGIFLALRLMATQPPNFVSVIPRGPCTSCIIPKDKFKDALSRNMIIAKEGETLLIVNLAIRQGGLVSTSGKGRYTSKEVLPVTYEGADLSIKANLRYILEAVKNISEDEVVLEIRGEQLPIVLTDKKGEHRNVIMPVRN